MASLLFSDRGRIGLLGLGSGTKAVRAGDADPLRNAALGKLYRGVAAARRADRLLDRANSLRSNRSLLEPEDKSRGKPDA